MNERKLREFALMVLDDEDGIRADAYDILAELLDNNESSDITSAVDIANGRAYIGEDIAEEYLRDISKWEDATRKDCTCDDCACGEDAKDCDCVPPEEDKDSE